VTANSELSRILSGPDDNVWFTEFGASQIVRLVPATPSSITIFNITNVGSASSGIAVGPDNNVWFVDCGTNCIGRSTMTGTITEFAVPTAN
jgi:virginiamycin B lyase